MSGKARSYLVLGVIFLLIGFFMILNNASRVLAYGDMVIGFCFLALSNREKRNGGQ
ncbi:MAG: hypothetical protein J6P61_05570 [Erysipelotrichaceae bacterium]|nr:hypothetical protein [Erysipelotrichaceae bacterium]